MQIDIMYEESEIYMVLNLPNKICYPSIADLERMDIQPKGRQWEV